MPKKKHHKKNIKNKALKRKKARNTRVEAYTYGEALKDKNWPF